MFLYIRPSVVAVFYCNYEENRRRIIENQNKMTTFAAQTSDGGQDMELQTVKTGKERLIASGASKKPNIFSARPMLGSALS